MQQQFPDPEQLRAFAADPAPFHEIKPRDLELLDNGTIRYGVDNVEYIFGDRYINIEGATDGEWFPSHTVDWADIDHRTAWDRADHTAVEEDYITARGVLPGHPIQYEAFWILNDIVIASAG